MEKDNRVDIYRKLEKQFQDTSLYRPMQAERYEAGTELEYDVTGVTRAAEGRVRLFVDKFIGGGFAGQVYRVKVLRVASENGSFQDLHDGGMYAMKILIPPSGFSRLFRNILYWIGFQGPFQLQVNPAAARAGALWQKFIRRGAKIRFGDETSVVDIHATFVDPVLGSCGELSEWIEGRTWRLEVDERLDLLKRWFKGKDVDIEQLGSPEYRAKYTFMRDFVALLHQMGAHEFARQYEWSTCKSQPNCLKRSHTDENTDDGLVAVDFRAGLALLPFLPMSPGDFRLIVQGLGRKSLVQFDRGSIETLEQFVSAHNDEFADMTSMLEELKASELVYRNSVPDVTHNHLRLFYSPRLWSTMLRSAVTGWSVRNLIDARWHQKLHRNFSLTFLFALLGLIPILGRFLRRIWGQAYWRKHYKTMLTSRGYLRRAIRAKVIERAIGWHRSGRLESKRALQLAQHPWPVLYHLPLSLLPAGLHKCVTDWPYAKERLDYYLRRPIRLYFNNELREQWLRDMVTEGQEKHLLSDEDAGIILRQIKEPYIQKYLKSLAVHVCTLPVTQVVSVMVAIIYYMAHPELPPGTALLHGAAIIAAFQVVPISPGSLVRGLYVVYLVIRERNFKDYNIAVILGFFKYIGYLAFPIQMTYRYPALARFMAGHWATEAVHAVPVFGERGALLEHSVFNLFYNWPLTIRRRLRKRSEWRATIAPRYWHVCLCALAGSVIFVMVDFIYYTNYAELPGLRAVWIFGLAIPLICGSIVTLGAGGASLGNRVIGGAVCGALIGVLCGVLSPVLVNNVHIELSDIAINCVWRVFVFTILSIIGVLLTELKMPEPEIGGRYEEIRTG
jgi:hypothetical protein